MSADLIIPYDGTANHDDALTLGKLLARDPTGMIGALRGHLAAVPLSLEIAH